MNNQGNVDLRFTVTSPGAYIKQQKTFHFLGGRIETFNPTLHVIFAGVVGYHK